MLCTVALRYMLFHATKTTFDTCPRNEAEIIGWVSCWWIILYLRTRAFIRLIDKTAAAWNVKKKTLNSIIFQRKKKKPEDDKRELNQNKHIYILYLWTAPFCFSPPLSRLNDSVILCRSVTEGGSVGVRIHNVPPPGQSVFNLGPFKLIWSAVPLTYLQ